MKIAFVFPGQGSQSVGMLKGYEGLPQLEQVRAEAAESLGAEFLTLLDEGPAEKLNSTVNTQPAMVTAGTAAYRAWIALGGPRPALNRAFARPNQPGRSSTVAIRARLIPA